MYVVKRSELSTYFMYVVPLLQKNATDIIGLSLVMKKNTGSNG